jgi:hypothetical protein
VIRQRLWVAVQAVVTVVLLALLARSLDRDALAALFGRLPIWFYAVSLTVVLAGRSATPCAGACCCRRQAYACRTRQS